MVSIILWIFILLAITFIINLIYAYKNKKTAIYADLKKSNRKKELLIALSGIALTVTFGIIYKWKFTRINILIILMYPAVVSMSLSIKKLRNRKNLHGVICLGGSIILSALLIMVLVGMY